MCFWDSAAQESHTYTHDLVNASRTLRRGVAPAGTVSAPRAGSSSVDAETAKDKGWELDWSDELDPRGRAPT